MIGLKTSYASLSTNQKYAHSRSCFGHMSFPAFGSQYVNFLRVMSGCFKYRHLLWSAKKFSRRFLDKSEVRPLPIVTFWLAFSRTWRPVRVFLRVSIGYFVNLRCDWLNTTPFFINLIGQFLRGHYLTSTFREAVINWCQLVIGPIKKLLFLGVKHQKMTA